MPGNCHVAERGDVCLLASPACKEYLRLLRQFLRHAAARKLAHDRPRDFGGLEEGWSEGATVRALQLATMHCPCGPALLCVGQWTRTMLLVVAWPTKAWSTACGPGLLMCITA